MVVIVPSHQAKFNSFKPSYKIKKQNYQFISACQFSSKRKYVACEVIYDIRVLFVLAAGSILVVKGAFHGCL